MTQRWFWYTELTVPSDPPPLREGGNAPGWVELVAAVSVVYEQALARLKIPVLVLDLPSRRIRAVNQAAADIFGVPVGELIGRTDSEVIGIDDEAAVTSAIAAMSSGAIDGYRARRRIIARDGVIREGDIWSRAIELDGVRYAVYILGFRAAGARGTRAPALPVNPFDPLVVGTADADWVVQRISSDIRALCGCDWRSFIGRSLISLVHPDDAGDLLRTSDLGGLDEMVTCRHLRMRLDGVSWLALRFLVIRHHDDGAPQIAFALLPDDADDAAVPADRVAQLERRLRRIAAELRAAGLMDEVHRLPTAEDHPELNELSSRQWEVLARLLRGDRVPTIAKEMHLSQATVRNHLSAIFVIFGVHSQAELLARLRPRR